MLKTSLLTDSSTLATEIVVEYGGVNISGGDDKFVKKLSKVEKPQKPEKSAKSIGSKELVS